MDVPILQLPLFSEMEPSVGPFDNAPRFDNSDFDIVMTEFHIASTYRGCLEGSKESVSPGILARLEVELAPLIASESRLHILTLHKMPLPEYRFLMRLDSRTPARNDDSDYQSSLTVCWFDDCLDHAVGELVTLVSRSVDWQRLAAMSKRTKYGGCYLGQPITATYSSHRVSAPGLYA